MHPQTESCFVTRLFVLLFVRLQETQLRVRYSLTDNTPMRRSRAADWRRDRETRPNWAPFVQCRSSHEVTPTILAQKN